MGFSISAAVVIIVTAVLVSATTLIVGFEGSLTETRRGFEERADLNRHQILSEVEIWECIVNDVTVSLQMRNLGTEVFLVNQVDLLINGLYSTAIEEETQVEGDNLTNIWGPMEDMRLVVPLPVEDDELDLLLMTGEGVVDIDPSICKVIYVVAPNGGERWLVDSYHIIKWRFQGGDSVKLEYSKDDFFSDINTIATATNNDGAYRWKVPNDISSTVKIRLSEWDRPEIFDISNDNFAIVGPRAKVWWPLNETSGSVAPNYFAGHDGTLNNMENGDWVSGQVANGLQLDGVDEYVTVGSTTTLNETSALSLAAWLKPTGDAEDHWKFKKELTIDSDLVTATLTDFPVLVQFTDEQLKDTLNSGYAQSDAGDMVFTLTDGTRLSHEIEYYDGATGELTAWVKVPSLSSTQDTKLYLYYGNPTVVDQFDPTQVWDSNYQGVWHLNHNTSDSTANGNDGVFFGNYITKRDIPLTSSWDDGEECLVNGTMDLASQDLDLVSGATESGEMCLGAQEVGLYFRNVVIPQGASVASAYIKFTGDEADSGATSLYIYAEDSDGALPFSLSPFDLTDRTKTSNRVDWLDLEAWSGVKGSFYDTPNLKRILQEVVDRSGWSSGNNLAILIEGSGGRVAKSWDKSSGKYKPILHLEYLNPVEFETMIAIGSNDAEEHADGTVVLDSNDIELVRDDGGGGVQEVGLRFENIGVTRGVNITAAYLEFTANATDTESTSLTLQVQAIDNAPGFTTTTNDISGRTKSTASVAWAVGSWTAGTHYQTPDLSTLIQELVDRPGWQSDNSLAFIITGSGQRVSLNKEADPWNATMLHLNFMPQGRVDGALYFDGADDEVLIPSDPSLDLTQVVSVEVLADPGKGTVGGIYNDSKVDNYEYETSNGEVPSMVKISGQVFAIAYQGPGDDGWLKTVRVYGNGTIDKTVIDELEFDTQKGRFPKLMQVSGGIYAIAYQGDADDGWLKTVSILSDGTIGAAPIDELEFDTTNGREPDIIQLSGEIYAIAYRGEGDDGWLYTVKIESDGNIIDLTGSNFPLFADHFTRANSVTVGNNWTENDGSSTAEAQILSNRLDLNTVNDVNQPRVMQHFQEQDTGTLYWNFTFNFERTGTETDYEVWMQLGDSSLMVDPATSDSTGVAVNLKWAGPSRGMSNHEGFGHVQGASTSEIGVVSGDAGYNAGGDAYVEVVAYLDTNQYDVTVTGPGLVSGGGSATSKNFDNNVDINCIRLYSDELHEGNFGDLEFDNMTVDKSINNALEFDTDKGKEPDLVLVSGEFYAIAYRGTGDDGWLKTVQMNSYGNINASVLSSYEFDKLRCETPDIIKVDDDVFAIAYEGSQSDGWIKSIQIDGNGTISQYLLDSHEFDTRNGEYPDLIAITGYIYAVAYEGPRFDGYLRVIKIYNSGQINVPEIDTMIWEVARGLAPEILRVQGDIYLLAYQGDGDDGYVQTIHIGSITIGKEGLYGLAADTQDIFAWINDNRLETAIAPSWNHIVMTYDKDAGADNFKMYQNGVEVSNMTLTEDIPSDTGDLVIGQFFHNLIDEVRISNTSRSADWIATTYNNLDDPAAFITVSNQTVAGIEKVGSYGLGSTRTQLYGTLNNQTLAGTVVPEAWNHVILSYNKDLAANQLRLYVNGSLASSATYTATVDTSASDLLLGEMLGSVGCEDEIRFYQEALNDTSAADLFNNYVQSVNLTTPNGGETWVIGTPRLISWTSNGDMEYVKLEYSKDNFTVDINTITASTPNDNRYIWTVPDDPSESVTIRISSVADSTIKDTSDANFTLFDNPIFLKLIQPDGGEAWQALTNKVITWENFTSIGNVSLEYSKDDFVADINVITASTEDLGYYVWAVPNDLSSTVKVRISYVNDTSVNDISAAYFSIVNPSLDLTAPDGGESWKTGTTRSITWTSEGSLGNVKLEYSKDDFVADVNTIVSSTPDDGSHAWTVVNDPSTTVRVRVKFVDNTSVNDVSLADLTIVLPTLSLVQPDGGEVIEVGASYYINWTSTNSPGNVKLEYSTDNFVSDIETIEASTADDDSYLWVAPADPSETVKVRISFVDAPTILDTSAAYFTIIGSLLTVTAPNGGEWWPALSGQTITWDTVGGMGNVKLEYSNDSFIADVNTIVANTADDGSYLWTIPDIYTDTVRVRVSLVSDPDTFDISDGQFSISSLKAWWKFDETSGTTASDSVGANDGDLHRGASFVSDGKLNYAVDLDGFDDHVDVIDDDALDFGSTSVSFSYWVQITNQGYMARKSDGSSGYWFYNKNGQIKFRIESGGTRKTIQGSTSTLGDGEWHHIVGVVDRTSDMMYIYMDKVQEDSTSIAGLGSLSNSIPLTMGAKDTDGNTPMVGALDEVRIYSRALTAAEVATLFDSYNLALVVVQPNGGEEWPAGTSQTITWTTTGLVNYVTLEYSKDNFTSDINTITSSIPNVGSYLWTIPYDDTTTARVRVSNTMDASINDTSDADHEMRIPVLTITAPNGGLSWQEGTTQSITWTSVGSLGSVRLQYSKDNFAADINTIVSSTPDDGSYLWTVPADRTSSMRVRVLFLNRTTVYDVSDADNTILVPEITIIAPNGGESWQGGVTYYLNWSSIDSLGNVKLEYSRDNFVADVRTISATTADDGSYLWAIAGIHSETVRVRGSFVANASYFDISDGDFSVDAMISHWELNETTGTTAEDTHGANDGTLNNMEVGDWISAVWGNGLQFDGIDENVTVPDDNTLDLTDYLTLSAWMKVGSGVTAGDIGPAVIDSREYDTTQGKFPSIAFVSGDIYAMAYQGDGDDGYVSTSSIASDGTIGAVIDTLEFDTVQGKSPRIVHVSGDIFAISYWGDGDDGWLVTVEIATNGQITDTVVDSLEYDPAKGKLSDIIQVSGDYYAIAYWGDGDDGWLATVEIATNGQITDTVVDSLEFDTLACKYVSMVPVAGDYFAIAYMGDGDDGWLVTVEIDSSGMITDTVVDSLEFDGDTFLSGDIVAVTGDYYAIAYEGPGSDGWLATVEIDSSGMITDTVVDTLEFDTVAGLYPNMVAIAGSTVAIVYQGPDGDGWLKTVGIAADGQIAAEVTDALEFEISQSTYAEIILVSGNLYTIVLQGPGDDGWLKTAVIKPGGVVAGKRGAYLLGSTSTTAYVNINDITFSTAINEGVWTLLTLTYDRYEGGTQELKLYVNDTLAASYDYSSAITINTQDLLLGFSFADGIDDVRLYNAALEASAISALYTAPISIAVTAPNGGEQYQSGTNELITWDSTGPFDNVKLEYSVDNFVSSVRTIVASTADDGSYSWAVAGVHSDTVRVRASFIYGAAYNDTSDGDFSVDALIDHWELNETTGTTAEDTRGANNGTLNNMEAGDWVGAVWGNGLQFDGVDENVTVPDDATLDLTDYLTLSAWVKVNPGVTAGDIGAAVIDSLEFETVKGQFPSIALVSGDIYAIAYQGNGDDGWLATLSIASDGDIGAAVIDTLEFDTAQGLSPRIIHVSGDIFAISYGGNGDDGWLVTVEIDSSGMITDTLVDSLEYDTTQSLVSDIVHVSGDHYAIAYMGNGDDGWLVTVEIASDGQITDTVIDSLEFDTDQGLSPRIIHVSGDIFAISYGGNGDDGWLVTVEIDSSGMITDTVVDSLEFDTTQFISGDIVHFSGDYFTIAYEGPGNDGWLVTVEINGNGMITDTVVDSLEFDTTSGKYPNLVAISGSAVAIAYSGNGDDGWLKTVEIENNGQIAAAVKDSLEFDTVKSVYGDIIHISGDIFAIPYQGDGDDGWITTIDMTTGGIIAGKSGAYVLGATSTSAYAMVNSKTLSAPISTGVWTLLTLTYDRYDSGAQQLKFYVNDTLACSAGYVTVITANAEDLVMGEMLNGTIDDVRLYKAALNAVAVGELYDNAFFVTLTAPNGGEFWNIGSDYSITWDSTGAIENVKLEYSKDSFVADIITIIASTANDGSYQWTIPNDPSTTVRVRVSDAGVPGTNDVSDVVFTIL